MRVVVPYVGASPHPATLASVAAHSADVELHRIDETDGQGYWRLLDELWRGPSDLVIVEHDVELHEDVLPSFERCSRPWCTFPYRIFNERQQREGTATMALGCVRFRGWLRRRDVELWQRFERRHWQRLDAELATRLHLDPFTTTACVHAPPVTHHHDYGPTRG